MSDIFKFENGDTVKDSITGYKGIIIGRTQWLNGCVRYSVQAPLNKDGKIDDGYTFDEQQLVLVKKKVQPKTPKIPRTGGPFPCAVRGQVTKF